MNDIDSMQFDLITDCEGLTALGTEWQSLEVAHADGMQLFQTFAWQDAWWRKSGKKEHCQLRIITGRSHGELVLVWPLVQQTFGPVRILQQGSGILACYDDLIVSASVNKEEWIESAWHYALDIPGIDALALHAVHASSALHAVSERFGGIPISSTTAPEIEITGDADKFHSELSKSMRKQQRRTWKALDRLGATQATINDPRLPWPEAITRLLDFKRSWVQTLGLPPSPLLSANGEAFLKELYLRCETHPILKARISTLFVNEEPIAIGLGFQIRGRHYDYCGAFDPAFSHTGCGRAQMEMCIRHSFNTGVKHHDLLTPETKGKLCWASNLPTVSQFIIPKSIRGKLYAHLYLRRIRPVLKRLSHILPAALRHKIQR